MNKIISIPMIMPDDRIVEYLTTEEEWEMMTKDQRGEKFDEMLILYGFPPRKDMSAFDIIKGIFGNLISE
jgi:hypothetical protein